MANVCCKSNAGAKISPTFFFGLFRLASLYLSLSLSVKRTCSKFEGYF